MVERQTQCRSSMVSTPSSHTPTFSRRRHAVAPHTAPHLQRFGQVEAEPEDGGEEQRGKLTQPLTAASRGRFTAKISPPEIGDGTHTRDLDHVLGLRDLLGPQPSSSNPTTQGRVASTTSSSQGSTMRRSKERAARGVSVPTGSACSVTAHSGRSRCRGTAGSTAFVARLVLLEPGTRDSSILETGRNATDVVRLTPRP